MTGPGERDLPSWDDLIGHQPRASHAEVRDAALAAMGEGRKVPRPVRAPRYVTDEQALADLHAAIGTP